MLPEHIAFIMDGNGRWAKKSLMPRKFGHKMGTEAMKQTVKNAAELGIKYVTFYAFSTENWSRPKDEIDCIFNIVRKFFNEVVDYEKNKYRIIFLGDLSALPSDIYENCIKFMQDTAKNTVLTISIALNYGSWNEVLNAVNTLALQNRLPITKDDLKNALYTRDIPFPDLIVRTGGERRLSNFLLLQSAYSELIFLDTLWPDFDMNALKSAIKEYEGRRRKYGGLGENDA